jgi:hypothetical protein
MTQKRSLSVAGVGILAIVANAGCNRNPQPISVVNPAVDAAPANTYPAANNYTTEEEPAYGMRPPVRTVSPQQVEVQQPYPEQPYTDAPRPYDTRHSYYGDRTYSDRTYRERRPRVVTRERSFGHSAAIVGGSAGAGAAIGALAGGGKGAGIGALAGGAGGFIYDRLTHKKRQVVEER